MGQALTSSAQQCGYVRTDLRMAVDADARVRHGDLAMSARLHDLSRGGAALVAFAPPPREARVTLEIHGRLIAARVAWSVGRRFGLCFETPLRAIDVLLFSRKGGSQPDIIV
jgi:hypothetical protein